MQIGQVQSLLELRWSHMITQIHFKKKDIAISLSHISHIKNSKLGSTKNDSKQKKKENGRQSKLKKSDLPRLEKMASKPEPPTQASMAKALNLSQQFVSYQLKHMLKKKCHEKPKCHHLNERSVQIKRQCSWPLYKLSVRPDGESSLQLMKFGSIYPILMLNLKFNILAVTRTGET
ncbi:hypothetical protein AVEN_255638-1 [Araneus ventricosus]|uniref:Uncharacterized protein n=1 Tax=Araneus ventricosus TaxID=182803 RepID=A0A4Y2TWC0_ARAVE|nr:hypothetical protein AVEN_255638-1 [Araneus ventricosus]